MDRVKALFFDVFGTVVDWRSSIVEEGRRFGERTGIDLDWEAFADHWRALYPPVMDRVRTGVLPWMVLDDLQRITLEELLTEHGVTEVPEEERYHFTMGWRRLHPWPDSVEGLRRLSAERTTVALSNGNLALIEGLAQFGDLSFDVILGAEPARHYKPDPEVYLTAAQVLRLPPPQVGMVAAHNSDLQAAKELGFKTVFVRRPNEFGKNPTADAEPTDDYDLVVDDLMGFARELGV
jgi:2-haloacid dehalogenase